MKLKLSVFATIAVLSSTAMAQDVPSAGDDDAPTRKYMYPKAPKDGTVDIYFGVPVPDPYRPLENDTSAVTAQWVEQENAVTQAYISKIPFRDALFARLMELSDYEKIGMPMKKKGKYYISRNSGTQNQSVLYTMDSADGEQKVLLDPNTLSDDGTVALRGTSFSNDGKYMAYTISRSGSDWQEIFVVDLATGETLSDHILWAKFTGAEWCGDGFYYSAYDAPESGKEFSNVNEGHKIYYHKIGTSQSDDVLFFSNPDHPKRFYGLSVNEEETLAFLMESGEGLGNNLYMLDLRVPGASLVPMTSDMDSYYYPIATLGDTIYIMTNYGAPKCRLMKTLASKPDIADWQTVVAESESVLDRAQVVGAKLILTYSKDASDHAYVATLDGEILYEIDLPMMGTVRFGGEKDDKECYYSFSSYVAPGMIYKYDIDTNESEVYAAPKVAFDVNDYTTEQVFYTSKDGTRVPMFITYKKGMERNGANPLLLYGYGGFNITLAPYFSTSWIPFLDSGGIYVEANLRGGAEYGEEWHLAGTKMNKQNVFDDFIAAAEFLIAEGYTNKDMLAITGGSNGGLLVGACLTQRPDLYKVAVPEVGVMDMLRYHKFTIGWNWASDYGTSEDSAEMFEYLRGYSPLHNIKPGTSYPATLITTADHDDRVVPAHSFKFAATMQECQAGDAPVLIRIDSKAGHGSGKPLAKVIASVADIYSFIMYNLGIEFGRPEESY